MSLFLEARGSEFSRHLREEIEFLTGQSILLLASIRHDQSSARFRFVLERRPLLGLRLRVFGTMDIPSYDQRCRVRTAVEIGEVAGVDVHQGPQERGLDQIHLERGIMVANDLIRLVSVEEVRGEKFYEATVRVKRVWIRICDEEPA